MVQMLGEMTNGFFSIFEVRTLVPILCGVPIGLLFGFLPGISGTTTLAILIPFAFSIGLGPLPALAFLLGAHAVVNTGGPVSAVLLNVPGTGSCAATLIDGYPMTQKGFAGRALGIVLAGSGLGGIFGGVVLALLIFVIKPIVLAFGLPEYLMLIVLGLSFISVIGSESAIKGAISGILGLFISFVGVHVVTGQQRFTFGSLALMEGFELITVGLGLFAVPSIFDLFIDKESTISVLDKSNVRPGLVWEGVKDCFRNFGCLMQSSFVGAFVGVMPGIGGEVASFMAYGIAKKTSKHPELFGTGAVEGILAPEAANNSKEGGALLPTLAFGIPGSAGMALMLGAFLLAGLQPGPLFLKEHLDIAFGLTSTLIFANVIGAVALLLISPFLSKITFVRGSLIGPLVLGFVALGAYCARGNPLDLVYLVMFGALGIAMKTFHYNRPALFLAVVLGTLFEKYFFLTMRTYGPSFLGRPITVLLMLMTVGVLFFEPLKKIFIRLRGGEDEK